jgi:4-oxalmesaconate hydratase
MPSEKPEKTGHWCVEACNRAIAHTLKIAPTRYRGLADLRQCAGVPITNAFEEIDRCINALEFIGIMINADPYEGSGTPARGMGDEYWSPLYEKMVQMDITALIHSSGARDLWVTHSNYFVTTLAKEVKTWHRWVTSC